MNLVLTRLDRFGQALPGDLYSEGTHLCVTLENADKAIPAGRYPVVFTESARSAAGHLWSPREDHVLPLVCDVPGRDGIRFHAVNLPTQLEGCIGTGTERDGETITQSRVALIKVMAIMQAALKLGETITLDVVDPA